MIRWDWGTLRAILEGLAAGVIFGLGADRALDAVGAALGVK